MQLEALSCNNCGAPLDLPAGVNFTTCAHCGSRLAVKRTGSAAYTEVLGQISQHTEAISANTGRMTMDLAAIRLQNELDRLDRDWVASQAPYQGHAYWPPDQSQATARLLVGVLAILVGLGVALGSAWGWLLFAVGFGIALDGWRRKQFADAHAGRYRAYLLRRQQIQDQLSKL